MSSDRGVAVKSHSDKLELPQRFGEFLLFDKIGQGGMAEIFLGKALGTLGQQRLTVIKKVLPLLSADPQFAEMLVAEAKLCASLNHKNVVQVTDLGRVDEQLYIAMEYVEGFDLNDLLRRCTKAKVPLPAEFIFLVMEEVLRALDYAHRAKDAEGEALGIIHRDVSPTNVLISCEGEVKLCDFGIARATATEGSLPEGVLKGKFAYMSPEQALGSEIDQRADLFAAGILLWELIAGHRLYRGNADEILTKARKGEAPPLPDRELPNPDVLQELVSRALSAELEQRYQTAREMLDELRAYVGESGLFASQLRFAEFLRSHFGDELQRQRREREKASTASPRKIDEEPASSADEPEESEPEEQAVVEESPVPAEEDAATTDEPSDSSSDSPPPTGASPAPEDDSVASSPEPAEEPSEPSKVDISAEETARLPSIAPARPYYSTPQWWVVFLVAALSIVGLAYYFLTR